MEDNWSILFKLFIGILLKERDFFSYYYKIIKLQEVMKVDDIHKALVGHYKNAKNAKTHKSFHI